MSLNRATGKSIIEMILQNMQDNLEPLQYKTLAPSLYRVYLNSEDYYRLEGIFSEISEEAKKALQEKLDQLNKEEQQSWLVRRNPVLQKLFKGVVKTYQISARDWDIRFSPDLDEELKPGDIVVSSQLVSSTSEQVAGKKTRRVTTRKSGVQVQSSSTYEPVGTDHPSQGIYAKISYTDNRGPQIYEMKIDRIKIGRGGIDHWVDLKLETLPDVSREHAHLRYDETSKQFYITDKSMYGMTLNGKKLEKDVEELLTPKARIGLADVLFLDFEAESR